MRQIIYSKKTGVIYTIVRNGQDPNLLLSNWDDAVIFECTDEQLSSDKSIVYYIDPKKKVLKVHDKVSFMGRHINTVH